MKGAPGETQTLYRPAIPFNFLGASSILRVSLPYAAASSGQIAGGNVEVMDLVGVSNKWGHWGAGAVATFGASSGFGIDTFRAGPAMSFVANRGSWLLGAVNKNLFSKNAAGSSIQPIISYQLRSGWSLGVGDLEYRFDWNRRVFATTPVGFQIGKVVEHGSRYFRFFVGPQYNLRPYYGAPRWTVTMGVSILSPGE
jgi:hypothetical protein